MTSELQELRAVFHGLESLYSTYLPKVDPVLLNDLLLREEQKSEGAPFYMVEVFTKPGTNSDWCKQHITETTGFVPATYDKGTHYVTNMRSNSSFVALSSMLLGQCQLQLSWLVQIYHTTICDILGFTSAQSSKFGQIACTQKLGQGFKNDR